MMTREYPPEIYGGAGVHVAELVRHLRRLCQVDVHCMGAPRPGVSAHRPDAALADANPALSTLSADLVMADAAAGASVVHSHTWYSALAGRLAALLYDIPHVLTTHSLEPLRPWKTEQLGGGYRVSSWAERAAIVDADAVIAVSSAMADDVLRVYPSLPPDRVHVVPSGIDTETWCPYRPGAGGSASLDGGEAKLGPPHEPGGSASLDGGEAKLGPPREPRESVLAELGVDPSRPIVVFVGRITRQKGVAHLVAAAHRLHPDIQLVLCAGAPDTAQIAAEVTDAVTELARLRTGVFWVREMLPVGRLREVLSAAAVFVCPSVYEPLGIVNLEAMACGTAVVASDVGGIPEVVSDDVTGSLVHYDPTDLAGYQNALADAINALITDPERAQRFGRAGRQRCIEEFSWAHVAEQTLEVYRQVRR